MKKNLSFLVIFFLTIIKSQNLSISDLIILQNSTFRDATSLLQSKNWQIGKISDPRSGKMLNVEFVLYLSTDDKSINSRINLYLQSNNVLRIVLSFKNPGKYYDYLDEMKDYNAKKIIIKVPYVEGYQNDLSTFIIHKSKEVNFMDISKYYHMEIWSTSDYNKNNIYDKP